MYVLDRPPGHSFPAIRSLVIAHLEQMLVVDLSLGRLHLPCGVPAVSRLCLRFLPDRESVPEELRHWVSQLGDESSVFFDWFGRLIDRLFISNGLPRDFRLWLVWEIHLSFVISIHWCVVSLGQLILVFFRDLLVFFHDLIRLWSLTFAHKWVLCRHIFVSNELDRICRGHIEFAVWSFHLRHIWNAVLFIIEMNRALGSLLKILTRCE